MITVYASEGAFTAAAEATLMRRLHGALAAALDATDNPAVSNLIGATFHIVPEGRYTLGGNAAAGVAVNVALAAVGLSTFRRRKRFITEATNIVAELATDSSVRERVHVQVNYLVDGGFGVGGTTFTNDFLDEGEPT